MIYVHYLEQIFLHVGMKDQDEIQGHNETLPFSQFYVVNTVKPALIIHIGSKKCVKDTQAASRTVKSLNSGEGNPINLAHNTFFGFLIKSFCVLRNESEYIYSSAHETAALIRSVLKIVLPWKGNLRCIVSAQHVTCYKKPKWRRC